MAGVSITERMVVFVGPRAPAPFTDTERGVGQFILPLGLADQFWCPEQLFISTHQTSSSSIYTFLRPTAPPTTPNLYPYKFDPFSMSKKEKESRKGEGKGEGRERKRGKGRGREGNRRERETPSLEK